MVTFEHYSSEAVKTRGQPQNIPPLALWALKLNGEAGEVAEKIGKFFRDGGTIDEKALIRELGDVLWYIDAIAEAVGSSLGEVAHQNIEKLRDRYQRGVIGGSGDNR
jgi:NTP pyrophosphatase (non-canonical NTP hydrolase)